MPYLWSQPLGTVGIGGLRASFQWYEPSSSTVFKKIALEGKGGPVSVSILKSVKTWFFRNAFAPLELAMYRCWNCDVFYGCGL